MKDKSSHFIFFHDRENLKMHFYISIYAPQRYAMVILIFGKIVKMYTPNVHTFS